MTSTQTQPTPRHALQGPVPKFRLRIADGDATVVGPGKIALLEAIAATGSITAAAKSLDMSYRHAWLLLDDLNRSLRTAAVDSAHGGARGGGSALTEEGRRLIAIYRRIEATAADACRADIQNLMGLLAR
ncbi:Putative transcriptional regulator, ModE family [Rubrivivax sp. A210]|uniref:winged helix-turn-helix domain-containing protein n=1 Tax=Rubrivivax sp. A210 TaxID=2772301 RepID=UPI0019191B79|nr:winged helix-turn-helix domain-containing protein [Rubrivivax sp. A210]CAD5372990.1 Putative transcriptional regulator, ModE family [Rubrivivax sp. A210]